MISYFKNFFLMLQNKLYFIQKKVSQNSVKELRFWEQMLLERDSEDYKKRYDIIRNLFPDQYINMDANKVADIGSGPLGGVFCKFKWPVMVAVDPLWDEYHRRFFNFIPKDIKILKGTAESLPEDDFDIIWAVNSLDHSGDLERSMKHLIQCLAPNGNLLLHIHMRTKNQLNKAHKMIVAEEQLRSYCDWKWVKIYKECPIERKPYKTWVGIYTK